MILGTAGHIDHGKTTLVKALTGIDTDRLPEEKRRGITIDLGFAPLELEGIGTVGVVDVPGHEAFVRTMVAGATGIDMALLVIAADEGIMPQTREHVAILEHLGVTRGVVALTKRDLVEAEWLEMVTTDVRGSHHERSEGSAVGSWPIIPVSATTGEGIPELRAALIDVAKTIPARQTNDLFRLPIDRVFTVKGTGTVVTGTVWSGELEDGATIRILPPGKELRVRGLQNHGHAVAKIHAGDRAAIALVGIDVDELSRGTVVVGDPSWEMSTTLRAEVHLDEGIKLGPRTSVRFHVGTSEVGARVVTHANASHGIMAPHVKGSSSVGVNSARDLYVLSDQRQNAVFPARIALDTPLVLRAGDRFVLRRSSPLETIGGGVVIDPRPPKRARPWPHDLTPAERLGRVIDESGSFGVAVAELSQRIGERPGAVRDLIVGLKKSVVQVGPRLWTSTIVEELKTHLRKLVAEHHREHPLAKGAPVNDLRAKSHSAPELFDHAMSELVASGKLSNDAGVIRQPGFSAELSSAEDALAKAALAELNAAGGEPPTVSELAGRHGERVANVLRFLERGQAVIQVEPGRYYTADSLRATLDRLKAAMPENREYSPAELREALGTSRKFLIPLLEYCDRKGLTVRTDTGRTWRK